MPIEKLAEKHHRRLSHTPTVHYYRKKAPTVTSSPNPRTNKPTMSGFSTSGHRASSRTSSNSSNSFLYTPYTGSHLCSPKSPKQPPKPYNPNYTRTRTRTKYDVRATYPSDHVLRQPYKVTKPRVAKPDTSLWRRSNAYSSSEGSPSSSTERNSPEPGFLPLTSIDATQKALLEKQAHELISLDASCALDADELRDIWTQLKSHLLTYCKNRVTKPFKKAGRWVRRAVADTAMPTLDVVAAIPSVVVRHGKMMCECTPEDVFWEVHGVEGRGLFSFLLGSEGSEDVD